MSGKKQIRLDEVTLMRTILAFLIVYMHAFTCYNHSWESPAGFIDIPVYMWLTRISFAFTLESFVFISGYLFAFQRTTLQRKENLPQLVSNKLKRLLLPSIIFSLLYFFIFLDYQGIKGFIYDIVSGCGHIWYLPMLFWCFVGGWLLDNIKIADGWKLLFLALINIFTVFTLPFQFSKSANFMFYFWTGVVMYKYRDYVAAKISRNNIICLWIVAIVLFFFLRPLKESFAYGDINTMEGRILTLSIKHICQLLYATTGMFAFYCTAVLYVRSHMLKVFTIDLASCCFGIYLFQQFILQFLYYKTQLPILVGPYWLPWLGFTIAAILSYYMTRMMLLTKTGKFLIG